ncbi:MAG: DNA polymerase III subunit gamma/tau [Firmicutes bacterium]|nr:DNA polymerase III subunit gamma/tau [Bacillota bacterium]
MSYIALYRKWRPLVFDDVVEQEHIVKSLKYSVNTGRIAHAYLFCGTRGTGKTTMAQILSRAVNCLNPNNGNPCNECEICRGILSGSLLDVMEIDAASNNSVDNVRDIRDEVIYTPSRAKYKVYIIDEVHMLSTGAFNALLKTLEEPPSHVIFILATTEPHKLPATILSRCQRYDFRRITVESIAVRLDKISRANGIDVENEALKLIARISEGALRDALSILDQCISLGNKKITYSDVLSITGMANEHFISTFVDSISNRDISNILILINHLVMEGKDISQFVSTLILYYRNLLICKLLDNAQSIIDASGDSINTMKLQASSLDKDEIIYIIKELSELESSLKWANHPRVMLEVTLIKICTNPVKNEPQKIENNQTIPAKQVSSQEGTHNIFSNSVNLVQIWDEVLKELNKAGKGPLCFILRTAKILEFDINCIGIILPGNDGANREIVSQPANIKLIEKILKDKLGKEVRVKCLIEKDLENIKKFNPEVIDSEIFNDDRVEKILSFATTFNAPFNIYDK